MLGNEGRAREAGATTIPEERDHLLPQPTLGPGVSVSQREGPTHPQPPFCFSSSFNLRSPDSSTVKGLRHLPPWPTTTGLRALCSPTRSCHYPAALHVQLCRCPQLCRALPPEALIMSLLHSTDFKGRPLPRESSPSSSGWRSRPFPVWLPPQALPPFCLPTGLSP